MDKKEEKIIKETIEEFLKLLTIEASFDFSQKEEGVEIILDTQDTALVIGYHGENLEALQLLLSLIISKKLKRFIRVSVEVGDYKKNRTEYLERLASQTKEKVISENKEYSLSALKPWERRIIHMYLKDDEYVVSESVGEGKERTLVVKPK